MPGTADQTHPQLAPKPKAPKDPNAPKRPPGRPRKDGSMPIQNGQGSQSDSASDLSVEDEEPEQRPAPLSVSMPTDDRNKTLFCVTEAVWSPRNKSAPVEKVKKVISDFGDTIKTLRDTWKTINENLKKAELPNAQTSSAVGKLKEDVLWYRSIMEQAVNRTLLFAHPAILKRYVFAPIHSYIHCAYAIFP